jgi:hypothetical protein
MVLQMFDYCLEPNFCERFIDPYNKIIANPLRKISAMVWEVLNAVGAHAIL